jgi:hypothetical protein
MTDKQIKELTYLKAIQSLRSDDYISIASWDQANTFSQKVLDATNNLIEIKETHPEYKIKGVFKDALLKLIKDAIDYDSKPKNPQITPLAYSKFHKTLITSRILFVSKSDLEFLTFFNRKLIKNDIKSAILGENIHEYNCKADFFEKFFKFSNITESPMKTFLKKFHYLVHSVHNTKLLPNIFTERGIQLKHLKQKIKKPKTQSFKGFYA